MRFYILSDLHLRAEVEAYKTSDRIKRLCSKIRQAADIGENILFIILGDIVDKGKELSFTTARDSLSLMVQNKHSTRSANEGSDAMLIFVIMGGQWMDGFFGEPSVRAVNSPPPSCYKDSIEQVAPAMPRARHEPI